MLQVTSSFLLKSGGRSLQVNQSIALNKSFEVHTWRVRFKHYSQILCAVQCGLRKIILKNLGATWVKKKFKLTQKSSREAETSICKILIKKIEKYIAMLKHSKETASLTVMKCTKRTADDQHRLHPLRFSFSCIACVQQHVISTRL